MINLFKKFFCGLLFVFFIVDLNSYTNKTYIRSLNDFYYPEKYSFVDFVTRRDRDLLDTTGSLSVIPFYYSSNDKKNIGRYFGVDEKNQIILSARNSGMDVYYEYLIHCRGVGNRVAQVSLNPETTAYGCNFSLLYDFLQLIKNFYAKINVPVIRARNNLKTGFDGNFLDIKNYLQGDYQNLTAGSDTQQEALKNGKFGERKSNSGVSDLDIMVAYELWYEQDRSVLFNLALIIPTSNKSTGEYLFEPMRGNSGHWGIRGAYEASYRFYEKNDHACELFFDLSYKYLFERTQKRIFSIKGANWGQYYLLGKKGSLNEPLIPAANVLTKNVKISPGSQLEIELKVLWSFKQLGFSLGYDFLFKEEEKTKLKDCFEDETYAVAKQSFNTAGPERFGYPASGNLEDHIDVVYSNYWLSNKNIDCTVAQNPCVLAHQFYAQFGFNQRFDSFVEMASFALGASYDFSIRNSSYDGYGFWFKTEVNF